MSGPHDSPTHRGDGWALALAGTAVGLVAAVCVILFEVSRGWWGVDSGRGIAGWAVAVALTIIAMLADYWLLLGVCRATGLKINMRRLEPKPPLPLGRYMAIFITASVVAIAGILLVQLFIPIGPVRSEIVLLTVGGSATPLEFADVRANRAYWAEKTKQATAASPWGKGEGGTA